MKIKIEPLKILKKLLIMTVIALLVVCIFSYSLIENEENKYQYLKNLDYNVTINEDGSANVTEIWDIYVKNTNTLFKSFNKSSRYGEITEVSVKDLDRNIVMDDYGSWVYHAPKDYFYAGSRYSNSDFEIGWGVDMENSAGWRKFEVKYKITDVVTKYYDCTEFYWQFLAEGQNAVPAERVIGTITLPNAVSNIENLKVWAHGAVNGNIQRLDTKTASFNIENLSPGAMVEIRLVTPEEICYGKIKNYNHYNQILEEEDKWSSETNYKIMMSRIGLAIYIGIEALIILINIFRIKKVNDKSKEKKVVKHKLEYYRDIPRENDSTPAEALYLSKFFKKRLDTGYVQQKAVASIILDLCLKKKISLRVEDKKTMVKIIDEPDGLKEDEKEVYNLIKSAGEDEYDIENLSKYAKKNYYKYSESINKVVNSCRNSLYKLKLIDKANEKNYRKGELAGNKKAFFKNIYIWTCIAYLISIYIPAFKRQIVYGAGFGLLSTTKFILIVLLPYIITKIVLWNKQESILKSISVLTQEGSDEKEQWLALKKYMEDYSLMKEKEVPDLTLWEKYLVYATAFGISEKVIDNLKATYPEVFVKESWDEDKMQEHPIINYAFNPYFIHDTSSNSSPFSNLSSSVTRAYNTSITEIARHSSSGGSGRRRRIFRRRWPAVEAGGRNGWQIKDIV